MNSSKKTNERIRLYYYDTSGRLVFVRFLEEIEDIIDVRVSVIEVRLLFSYARQMGKVRRGRHVTTRQKKLIILILDIHHNSGTGTFSFWILDSGFWGLYFMSFSGRMGVIGADNILHDINNFDLESDTTKTDI